MNRTANYDIQTNTYHVPCVTETMDVFSGIKFSSSAPLTVSVPGSKSITNRALLLATLAENTSILRGVLFSDDSRHFLKCIQDLGFETTVDEASHIVTVTGQGGVIPRKEAALYVGSAGTAARFLTACLGVSHGSYHMDASGQMRKRPMAPLLSSLTELGCEILYETSSPKGFFPFTLKSNGFSKKEITINIEHSSQFLSALLISSCLAGDDFSVKVEGTHGMAYIDMTRKMMEQFGVFTVPTAENTFFTEKGQHYHAMDYQIEPDVSAACYFYALGALLRIPVLVNHVHFDSLQGDVAFLKILEQMGCTLSQQSEGILSIPPSNALHGVTVDMSACSDQAITLAAMAPFADTPTTITGIGHIRFQESDRIHAIVTELDKMGICCEEDSVAPGSITIYPGHPKPCLVETYDDHRMAMGFSLIGLCSPGIAIHDPGCCRKTFENYFQVLESVIKQLLPE